MSTMLDDALAYAARGWSVLPLHTPYASGCSCRANSACTAVGKHPRTRHGCNDASRESARLLDWWRAYPDANVGIATGQRSDLLIVDVDPRNGGRETLDGLERELGCLPQTASVRTGGGGWHFYFRLPREQRLRATLGPGIDVKRDGGYVVAPPSRHASGAEYSWSHRCAVASVPEPWIQRLSMTVSPGPIAAPRSSGEIHPRAERRARLYARALPPAIAGSGGHRVTFLAAVRIMLGFELDASTAFAVLWQEWNPRCRPPWSERELRRKVDEASRSHAFTPGFLLRETRGGLR